MKKTIILIITLILLIIAILGIIFISQINCHPNFEGTKEFTISKGETVNKIAQNLLEQELIKSKFAFVSYLYIKNLQTSVQAGTYLLTPLSIAELAEILVSGRVDNEANLKIIEGWNLKEIAELLKKQMLIKNENEFLDTAKINNFKDQYEFLKDISAQTLEGFIFPDTYRVYKDAELESIIEKTLDNFNQKITDALKTEITAQGKNLYDVLIMASIIEQEVPNEEDRKIVAGILWKRLAAGMKLQVDSSLKYVIGKKDRNVLSYEELRKDSPYNTYKYTGLPPTPICNPGLSALRAAIYPKNSDYWFYLSTDEGETIFSKTGTEHEKNVEKYLK